METLKIILVEPMKKPRVVEIDNTLESLQETVGGHLQAIFPWDGIALVCNEEGKLNGSLPNRLLEDFDVIYGTFFLCGCGAEDFASIPEGLVPLYLEKFNCPERFFRLPDGRLVCERLF